MKHGADQEYILPNTGAAFSRINTAMKQALFEPGSGDSGSNARRR